MEKLMCVAYIALMVGMAAADVGDMPKTPPEPFAWYLPIIMLLLTAIPAALGYFAGIEDGRHNTAVKPRRHDD